MSDISENTVTEKKSRRKPAVVHKITEEDEDFEVVNTSHDGVCADEKEEENEEFVIPEGTVIVNPEPVEEAERKVFKGPEWKATKLRKSDSLGSLYCTACSKQINPQMPDAARRHPLLKVLICKKCYNWYTSEDISKDEDGYDDECRWCGEGGNLVLCDYCQCAFCKKCIKKNLGRNELASILEADDDEKWQCYVCDPKPLANLIEDCTVSLKQLEAEAQKDDKASKSKTHSTQKKVTSKKSQVAKKSTNKPSGSAASPIFRPEVMDKVPAGAILAKSVLGENMNLLFQNMDIPAGGLQISAVSSLATPVHVRQIPTINTPKGPLGTIKVMQKAKQPQASTPRARTPQGRTPPQIARPQPQGNSKSPSPRMDNSSPWNVDIDTEKLPEVMALLITHTDSLRSILNSIHLDVKKISSNTNPKWKRELQYQCAYNIRRVVGNFQDKLKNVAQFAAPNQVIRRTPTKLPAVSPVRKPPFVTPVRKPSSVSSVGKPPSVTSVGKPPSVESEVIELSDSDEEQEPKNTAKKALTGKAGFQRKIKMNDSSRKRSVGGNSPEASDEKRRRGTDQDDAIGKEKVCLEEPTEILDPVTGSMIKIDLSPMEIDDAKSVDENKDTDKDIKKKEKETVVNDNETNDVDHESKSEATQGQVDAESENCLEKDSSVDKKNSEKEQKKIQNGHEKETGPEKHNGNDNEDSGKADDGGGNLSESLISPDDETISDSVKSPVAGNESVGEVEAGAEKEPDAANGTSSVTETDRKTEEGCDDQSVISEKVDSESKECDSKCEVEDDNSMRFEPLVDSDGVEDEYESDANIAVALLPERSLDGASLHSNISDNGSVVDDQDGNSGGGEEAEAPVEGSGDESDVDDEALLAQISNLGTSQRTRSDLEAQRALHKILLEEEELSEEEKQSPQQEESSSDSSDSKSDKSSSGEEFVPKSKPKTAPRSSRRVKKGSGNRGRRRTGSSSDESGHRKDRTPRKNKSKSKENRKSSSVKKRKGSDEDVDDKSERKLSADRTGKKAKDTCKADSDSDSSENLALQLEKLISKSKKTKDKSKARTDHKKTKHDKKEKVDSGESDLSSIKDKRKPKKIKKSSHAATGNEDKTEGNTKNNEKDTTSNLSDEDIVNSKENRKSSSVKKRNSSDEDVAVLSGRKLSADRSDKKAKDTCKSDSDSDSTENLALRLEKLISKSKKTKDKSKASSDHKKTKHGEKEKVDSDESDLPSIRGDSKDKDKGKLKRAKKSSHSDNCDEDKTEGKIEDNEKDTSSDLSDEDIVSRVKNFKQDSDVTDTPESEDNHKSKKKDRKHQIKNVEEDQNRTDLSEQDIFAGVKQASDSEDVVKVDNQKSKKKDSKGKDNTEEEDHRCSDLSDQTIVEKVKNLKRDSEVSESETTEEMSTQKSAEKDENPNDKNGDEDQDSSSLSDADIMERVKNFKRDSEVSESESTKEKGNRKTKKKREDEKDAESESTKEKDNRKSKKKREKEKDAKEKGHARSSKDKGQRHEKKKEQPKSKKAEQQREAKHLSSHCDSDLEREIEKLSKFPTQLQKKKRTKKENEENLLDISNLEEYKIKPCYVKLIKNDKRVIKALKYGVYHCTPTKKQRRKAEKKTVLRMKRRLAEQLSSDEEGAAQSDSPELDDHDEMDEVQVNGVSGVLINGGDADAADRIVRRARLGDSESEAMDSEDSDVNEILAGKEKPSRRRVNGAGTAGEDEDDAEELDNGDQEEEEQSDYDTETGRKCNDKWKKNKLLTASISSESDFDVPKKRRKKKSSDEDQEEEEEDKEDNASSDSDFEQPKKTKKKSSDEDQEEEEEDNEDNASSDSDFQQPKKTKKKKKKDSDSDDSLYDSDSEKKNKKGKKRRRIKKMASSDSDVELVSGGESGEEGSGSDGGKGQGRKKIRKIMKDKKISDETKTAAKIEEERRKRIEERQKLYNQVDEDDVNSPTKAKITTKLVLEMDEDREPIIEVVPSLIRKLKPHQVEAVRFMWDCCVEDLKRLKKEEGSGCILAHCMGLGKTLSVITFSHTLLHNESLTRVTRVLIVCPLNTVLNWYNEWHRWVDGKIRPEIYEMSKSKDVWARVDMLKEWHTEGGVMIMGYEMYRNLASLRNVRKKKQKEILTECLVDPGPDLIVCDEGHVLKNDASALSKAMTQIKTLRRIVLTGTPLQNNLVEYHCMVDFVKPKLLGTRKEFMNRFVNPITNGQHKDSTSYDVNLMKKRAHILHETLAGCVQRKDYIALTKFLLPKREYVISIRLSEQQIELYDHYLQQVGHGPLEGEKLRSAQLFKDYQFLMRIWTHPWILKLQEVREEKKRSNESDEDSFIDDGEDSEMDSFLDDSSEGVVSDSSDESGAARKKKGKRAKNSRSDGRKRLRRAAAGDDSQSEADDDGSSEQSKRTGGTEGGGGGAGGGEDAAVVENRVSSEWWAAHVREEDQYDHALSGKLVLLVEILKMTEAIGDKVLVFSQSLLSLDLIESFLAYWDGLRDSSEEDKQAISGTQGWVKNLDYFRMDGSTSAQNRTLWATRFNSESNRARLFLISTKAGSLGTNLVGANRVIVFDASWNPSHDTQSIFRVYRFGQTKPTFIYRFLAQGTMEEKIYERQVMKQSLSQRVVDEQQVARHFTSADLRELYCFTPDRYDPSSEYLPILPKDRLLAELLKERREWIVKYHEHDSLLENKVDEDLTEEERKAAWEEFEEEKKQGFRTIVRGPPSNTAQFYQHYNLSQPMYGQGPTNTMYPSASSGYGANYLSQLMSMQNIEMVAKAIYAANPGLTPEQLQARVQAYVQTQVAQQQMLQMQSHEARVQQEMIKLRQLQAERQRQSQLLQAAYQGTATTSAAGGQRLGAFSSTPALSSLDAGDERAASSSAASLNKASSSAALVSLLKQRGDSSATAKSSGKNK